ncbi:MAG: LOG family protein [Planctomycetaceae bacterium]|nr:LOG family protein [Planctomycetaceae bacterium]
MEPNPSDIPQRISPPNLSEEHPLATEHVPETTDIARLVEEIKETADKFARDNASRGDLKIVSRALKELRYAFKVFKPFRRQRKVTVFGSARTKADDPAYEAAVKFGQRFADAGWYVVTGAGGGIMEAGHVGAGRRMSMGLNIMLPFEQDSNYVISKDEKLVNLKYFFTRKLLFVKEVHAVACFPGGFGTQDEAFETLTLIQTGKRDLMPVVMVDEPGGTYWSDWEDYISTKLLKEGLISKSDLSLFKVTDDPEVAFREVMQFYCVYNSMRYVREKLCIRLHTEPSSAFLKWLSGEFSDILESGTIEKAQAHPMESDDEHLAELPRIVMHFNRRDLGRLRQMINVINQELASQSD